jgi:uncharacterized protein (TIGR03000 family)
MSRNLMSQAALPAAVAGILAAAAPSSVRADDAPAGGLPAQITLRVPADARVWFDGEPTRQSGTTRAFVSPTLAPGRAYVYMVRVRWEEDGDVVEKTRRLKIRAGEAVVLDCSGPGFLELRGYSAEAEADPAPVFVPAPYVPATAPRAIERPAGEWPRPYSPDDHPRRGGPPGSNHPLSLGVGHG